jgi:hypothetical protein
MTVCLRRARPWLAAAILLGGFPMALGGCYPRINDIATDLDDPPRYLVAPPERPGYNAAKYRAAQEAGYPGLRNLAVPWPPPDAFARVLAVVRRRGWAIAAMDEPGRRVQAVAVTPLLRFRDDVVIEVRPPPPGAAADARAIIAMRSKSRLGRGDFGANARRIRAFFLDLLAGP